MPRNFSGGFAPEELLRALDNHWQSLFPIFVLMKPFYARSESNPPQAVELWFENQERADQAFAQAFRSEGMVTDDRCRTFRGLALDARCHQEEDVALRSISDHSEATLYRKGLELCGLVFRPTFWHPRMGLDVLGFMLNVFLYSLKVRLVVYAKVARKYILLIALVCIYPFAMLVIGIMLLLRRWGILSFKDA
jgi:hypothetical protein